MALQPSFFSTASTWMSSPASRCPCRGIGTTLPARTFSEELMMKSRYITNTVTVGETAPNGTTMDFDRQKSDPNVVAELYAILGIAADRAEMHANIGEQRDYWNQLLLTSINAITLTAATTFGLAATTAVTGSPFLALKLSSTLLYAAATGMLVVMNKIQPSQLAEEQRNAVRLFKQLHWEIQTTIAIGNYTKTDVKDFMDQVLALDKAFPLPLLGAMLDKFPAKVEPAVWWPQERQQKEDGGIGGGYRERKGSNGWNVKLEEEMRQIVGVLKRKDTAEYIRLGELVLKINKILAISGPLLTGVAGVCSAFAGSASQHQAPWAVFLGLTAGALATVVNTVEHGGQVGMIFEMYRGNAGFFKLMEESIGSTLKEKKVEKRMNGELFEMKVALQLGRTISELRHLADSFSPGRFGEATEEFASKLF